MGWFIAVGLIALAGGSFYAGNKYGAPVFSGIGRLTSGLRKVKGAL